MTASETAAVRHYQDLGAWVVADKETARAALGDTSLSSRTVENGFYLPAAVRAECAELLDVVSRWFVLRDGEDHLAARRAIQPLFSPGKIRRLRGDVDSIVEQALDELPGSGVVDVVARLTEQVSARTLARLLGLPATGADEMHRWARALAAFLAASYRKDHAFAAQEALREMRTRFEGGTSGEDTIWNRVDGSPQDRLATCSMILFGGLETTTSLMGTALWYVLENGLVEQVTGAAGAAEAESVVERVLELYPPLGHVARSADTDVELGGCPVSQGDLVLVSLTGHDPFETEPPLASPPRHTPDAPRPDHLAFGHGMHYCTGAALARLETVALLDAFARRNPRARVADRTWGTNRTYRRFDRLGVDLAPGVGE
ncbi:MULTISPECIES: cytochrome P450 [unclassified Streptomyces]|uniref:cytochrome P450 n=1 Tax=unclassified Streptomyces TaxID=2593676 RepID=UPI0036E6C78C